MEQQGATDLAGRQIPEFVQDDQVDGTQWAAPAVLPAALRATFKPGRAGMGSRQAPCQQASGTGQGRYEKVGARRPTPPSETATSGAILLLAA